MPDDAFLPKRHAIRPHFEDGPHEPTIGPAGRHPQSVHQTITPQTPGPTNNPQPQTQSAPTNTVQPQAQSTPLAGGPTPNLSKTPVPIAPTEPISVAQPYDFIVNPASAPRKDLLSSLPGGNSILTRLVLVAGGLAVLLVIFVVFKALLGGGSSLTSYVGIVQDQQAIIHLTNSVALQTNNVSTTNRNFAITAQLSLGSSQSKLITYLAANNTKLTPQQKVLKVSASTDKKLTASVAATTYDQTFHEIAQAKLNTYSNDLKLAYQHTKGKNGRALLQSDYNQAQLLNTQLNTSTN